MGLLGILHVAVLAFSAFLDSSNTAFQPLEACNLVRITYYDYNNGGSCGFGQLDGITGPGYLYGAAPNEAYYGTEADHCGECYELFGPLGSVRLMVVDRCPVKGNEDACSGDMTHFDLTKPTFPLLADPTIGRLNVTARKVVCDVTGPVKIFLKKDMSPWWFSILVFNYKIQVRKVELLQSGSEEWISLPRANYNQWELTSVKLNYPVTVRLTSIHDSQVQGVILNYDLNGTVVEMDGQFSVDSSKIYDEQCCPLPAYHQQILVDGEMKGNWNNEAWGCTLDLDQSQASPAHSHSVKVTLEVWGGLQLGNRVYAKRSSFTRVQFLIKASAAQNFKFYGGNETGAFKFTTTANEWQTIEVTDLAANGFAESFRSIVIKNNQATEVTFWIDDYYFDQVETDCSVYDVDPGNGSQGAPDGSGTPVAAIVVPIVVVLVLAAVAIVIVVVYIYTRKKNVESSPDKDKE